MRKLLDKLYDCDVVQFVKICHDCIKVVYHTGVTYSYIYDEYQRRNNHRYINEENAAINTPINYEFEFTWDPINGKPLEDYFHVSRKEANRLGYMGREILCQEILSRLQGKIIKPHIPDELLDKELEFLGNMNEKSIITKGIYNIGKRFTKDNFLPGRPFIERFYPLETMHRRVIIRANKIKRIFECSKILKYFIDDLVHKSNLDINITNLYRRFYIKGWGPKWFNPGFWKVIADKYLDVRGSTLTDLTPMLCERAITASLLRCNYAIRDTDRHNLPDQEMLDYLNVKIISAVKPYEFAIYDNRMKPYTARSWLAEQISMSENMIAYVSHKTARETLEYRKPTKVLRFQRKAGQKPVDYLFIYSAKIK